jgi:hypothetical protein
MEPKDPKEHNTVQLAEFLSLLLQNTIPYSDEASRTYLTNTAIFSQNTLPRAMRALEHAKLISSTWSTPGITTEFNAWLQYRTALRPFTPTTVGKKIVSSANFVRELIRSERAATNPSIGTQIMLRSLNEKGRITDIILMLMNQKLVVIDMPTESILAAMAGWEAGGAAPSLSDLRILASIPGTPIASRRAGPGSPAHGLGITLNTGGAAEQPAEPALMSTQYSTYKPLSGYQAEK